MLLLIKHIPHTKTTPIYDSKLPIAKSINSLAQCTKYTIPVTVTSENYVFNITKFENDFDLMDLVTNLSRKDSSTAFNQLRAK